MVALDLVKKQEEIDKVYEELKKLNTQHNEYLSSEEKMDSTDRVIDDILKMILQTFLIQVAAFILFVLSASLPILAFIFSIPFFVWLHRISKGVRKLQKEGQSSSKIPQDLEEERVYEKLCETRALYHRLVKELDSILEELPTSEYQEYLHLLKEYQEVVEEYVIQEEKDLGENVDSFSLPMKSAINLRLNKSKVQ